MKHKNHHDKAIIIVFSIALFIIIIFGSLNYMIFNKGFYLEELAKNDVYDSMPAGIDAENATTDILRYLRSQDSLEYFNAEESSHMSDVKHLVRIMQFCYYGAALLIVGLFYYSYRKFKGEKFEFIKILSKSLLYSSISAIIFLVLIFLMAVFSFDLLFTLFHLIFFPQGNWMFDSSSLLITIFPKGFFFDISLRIFVYAMFQSIIFFFIGYWMRKQMKTFERFSH